VAGAVLLAFVVLELGLRTLGVAATIEVEPPRDRDPSEYTILCLGDSWTHGLGSVSYGEWLEEKLNAAGTDGRHYRVVRSGIPGSNSSQGIRRLKRLLRDDTFDMLIVLVGNNDHQNLADSEYWKFDTDPGPLGRVYARARVLTHSLRTYKLLKTVQLRLTGRPTLDKPFVADSPNVPVKNTVIERGAHRRLLEHNLTSIVDVARLYDIELVFMTYFYFHGYDVTESILDVAMTYGTQVVNNTVLFHQRIPVDARDEFFVGGHPTTEGHAFIADNIIEFAEFD
jgi:lysophospholipase L1-like esterase